MIDERDRRNLEYIRQSIDLVAMRTRGDRGELSDNIDIRDAVLWRLQTLAEATGKLPQQMKDRHPNIRWRAIYGFRNIAAHAYLDLHLDRVWEIIELHLPMLRAVVEDELSRLDPS